VTAVVRRSIHGVGIAVECDAGDVAELVDRRLGLFPAAADAELAIEVRTSGVGDAAVPPAARVVHESPNGFVAYDDASGELWARYGERGHARCSPSGGTAQIEVDRRAAGWEWVATRPLLTLSLLELLKRRGLFGVHAAAAARGDDAVLVAGATGAGKSTVALALTLAGWSFLGDDLVFLRSDEPQRALAFPDEVDATPATFDLFPALGLPHDWPTLPGYAKHQLRAASLPNASTSEAATARVVLLPRVTAEAEHGLEPVRADEVLMELVPNVLLTDPETSREHLDLLGRLAAGLPAFRLALGADPATLPPLLDDLLASIR
jgi:hypothetical protein